MVKVKMFLCACLCILAVQPAPAKGDSIEVSNGQLTKERLSDLIVYGDPNNPNEQKVILKPNDPKDDIIFDGHTSRRFNVKFKITKFELSTALLDDKDNVKTEVQSVAHKGKIIEPTEIPKKKKVGMIWNSDGQQTVVLAIDQAVAPEPPPEGTILAFVDGYNELMPGWFVGTDINFETGEVTGAYTGNVEVFCTAFEVFGLHSPLSTGRCSGYTPGCEIILARIRRSRLVRCVLRH